MIINLTGTSLLSNKLQIDFRLSGSYPEGFINCLDQELYHKISSDARKDYSALVPLLSPAKEECLTNYLMIPQSTSDLPSISAETKTLSLIISENDLKPREHDLFFLASNTVECRACANVLKTFYETRFNIVQVIVIDTLISDASQFEQGLRDLVNKVVELASVSQNNTEVFINATAGYKPESGYAALCGLLLGTKVYYGHEQFNKIVELPALPVGVDFNLIHLHASKIVLLIEAGISSAYDDLPRALKDLFKGDGAKYYLTEVGSIFWSQYLSSLSEYGITGSKWLLTDRIKNESLREKIVKYIKAWDHIWVGMQVPQMVDHTQSHCQNLLNLGDQLFSQLPDDFLSEEETYLLLAAIWLHDIGHSEPVLIDESGTTKWLSLSDIRKMHPQLAYQRIKYNYDYFGFEEFDNEAELIALLCKYHNTKTDIEDKELTGGFSFMEKPIRLKLLVGLLRLLDVSDNGIQRIGGEDYRRFREKVTESEIRKFSILRDKNLEGSFAFKIFDDEIEFREKQKQHFLGHAAVERTTLKVKTNNGKYQIELIFYPVRFEGYLEGTALTKIKNIIGLDKLNNAEDILKVESGKYIIENIRAVEAS